MVNMTTIELKDLIREYIKDPENDNSCYNLAIKYHIMGQSASSVGFFLRCAELTKDPVLAYKSLVLSANNLFHQGNRIHSTTGCLLHAISVLPERPEAWFNYAKILEIKGDNQECYSICCTALKLCDFENPFYELEFPGKWGFLFLKAVTGWRIGRGKESREILSDLYFNVNMLPAYEDIVLNNLNYLGVSPYLHTTYYKTSYNNFKWKFPNLEKVERNYSQCYQDLFVLSVLKGKYHGKYLEIGAAEPFHGNNTALLERLFKWKGISIEINPDLVSDFKNKRENVIIEADATKVNYENVLTELDQDKNWDYLQLDCDPPKITFEILQKIPFDKWKFAVITYEHDIYLRNFEDEDYRQKSREFLTNLGYVLLVGNISSDNKRPFEDWWVHPELVDQDIIQSMKKPDAEIVKAETFMLS